MQFSTDRVEFDAVLPPLIDEMTDHFKRFGLPSNVVEHVRQVTELLSCHKQNLVLTIICQSFETNLRNGKLFRGLTVPETGCTLLDRPLSSDEFHDLGILGWLVEMFQAYLLVIDDIIDGSATRRGQTCWYRRPSVGLLAINDACVIRSAIFALLKSHFREHPCYLQMLESFNEIILLTESGQEADAIASQQNGPEEWTMDQYQRITLLKGGYYVFYLPVLLGLQYLNLATPLNVQEIQNILIPLGQFYQFQNDFLDVLGDSARTGKIGTDIQENKCSWVVIQALRVCQDSRWDIICKKYGCPEQEAAAEVNEIFHSLPLSRVYEEEADEFFTGLQNKTANVDQSEGLRKGTFEILAGVVYNLYK